MFQKGIDWVGRYSTALIKVKKYLGVRVTLGGTVEAREWECGGTGDYYDLGVEAGIANKLLGEEIGRGKSNGKG